MIWPVPSSADGAAVADPIPDTAPRLTTGTAWYPDVPTPAPRRPPRYPRAGRHAPLHRAMTAEAERVHRPRQGQAGVQA